MFKDTVSDFFLITVNGGESNYLHLGILFIAQLYRSLICAPVPVLSLSRSIYPRVDICVNAEYLVLGYITRKIERKKPNDNSDISILFQLLFIGYPYPGIHGDLNSFR